MPDDLEKDEDKTIDHGLYLKAVNHPVRRVILEIVNEAKKISHKDLLSTLLEKETIREEFALNYNLDYLIKAFCIKKVEENAEIFYEITQLGNVVEYYEE
jgi:hypothetical protein